MLSRAQRVDLQVERDAALVSLAQLDAQLLGLATRRRELLDELDELREELWPRLPFCRVARPPAVDRPPLPPAVARPSGLIGKELRHACLALLDRYGAQQLRDLHALLHVHGYVILHHHPVKALADALGYEADMGRVERVRRGVYALDKGFRPRAGRHGHRQRLGDHDARQPPNPWAQILGGEGVGPPTGPPHIDPDTSLDADQWLDHAGFPLGFLPPSPTSPPTSPPADAGGASPADGGAPDRHGGGERDAAGRRPTPPDGADPPDTATPGP